MYTSYGKKNQEGIKSETKQSQQILVSICFPMPLSDLMSVYADNSKQRMWKMFLSKKCLYLYNERII